MNGFSANRTNLLSEMDGKRRGKNMKSPKILFLFSTLCLSFFLFACENFAWDYQFYLYYLDDREISEIVQISMVNYVNPVNEENQSENAQYDVEKLIVLETLNSEDYEDFLGELSEIGGMAGRIPEVVSSPNGTGILVAYQDGGFTLITVSTVNDVDCIFWGDYNSNATPEYYFGISWPEMIDDFEALILKYFDTEIN